MTDTTAAATGNTQTKELVAFLAGFLNTGKERLADGFQPLEDLVALLPLLLEAQPAFKGIDQIPEENATMELPQMQEIPPAIAARLAAWEDRDKYDLTAGLNGLLSILRMVWRKGKEAGEKAGERNLLEDIFERGMDLEDLRGAYEALPKRA